MTDVSNAAISESSAPPNHRGGKTRLILIRGIAVLACTLALLCVWLTPHRYPKFPIDAYYYMEMARNVAAGRGPVVRFEQGVPNKFFVGYPLALAIPSLFAPPHVVWQGLHSVYLLLLLFLIPLAVRSLGDSEEVAWTTCALTLGSSVFLKWASLPYAELQATLLCVGMVPALVWAMREPSRALRWLLAGIVAGLAILTRPTAAWWVLFAAIATLAYPRALAFRSRMRQFVWFVVPALLLPGLYLSWRYAAGTHPLPYAAELIVRPSQESPITRFLGSLMQFYGLRQVDPPSALLNAGLVVLQIFQFTSWLLGGRGYLGKSAAVATGGVVGFLVLHSFWQYSSERFNLLALPPTAFLLARWLEWWCDSERTVDKTTAGRAGAFLVLVSAICLTQWLYTPVVLEDHIRALRENTGRPRELAELANTNPRTAWIEIGPEFAYYFQGRTIFDRDEPFFYRRLPEAEKLFAQREVAWVVTNKTEEDWLRAHPGAAASGVRLYREADDGVWTLYRVEYRQPPLVPQK
ncbi:MAG: hypothetical protein KatS3mg130_0073 [Candidatus Sumerlaea sp.]|nr:hypothetical protein [Candidatus Sumerlaea chitinivorans]GIX43665.1 MAG: hypothetical protein KatS3mg130_0073 [Candidatus Sumerlaea sp.]